MSSNHDHVKEFNMNQLATASAFVDSDANFIAATSFGVPTDQTPFPTVTTPTTMNHPLEPSEDIQNDIPSNNGTHGSVGAKSAKKRRTSPSASTAKIQQLPMFLTSTSFEIYIYIFFQVVYTLDVYFLKRKYTVSHHFHVFLMTLHQKPIT
jgi:hypothetical protein